MPSGKEMNYAYILQLPEPAWGSDHMRPYTTEMQTTQ